MRDPRTRLSEVLAYELCAAGHPAQLRSPRKDHRASPPAGCPPGNRESCPGHVSLTTSALASCIFGPARSFFLDSVGGRGPAEDSWAGGRGPGLAAGMQAPFREKSRLQAVCLSPGRFGAETLSSSCRARPVTVQDREPGRWPCPHLVDTLKCLLAAPMGLATDY